jgi:heat shock protein HtpX
MLTRTLKDPRVLPIVLAVVTVAAVLVAVVLALVGLPWWLGLVLGAVLGAVGAFLAARRGRSVVLSGLTVVEPRPEELARLDNLLDGLWAGHGMTAPTVVLVDTEACNACVVEGGPGVTLVVTRGLLAGLRRVELEGVLAHELALVRDGEAAVASVLAGFASVAPFGLAERVVARMGDSDRVVRADLAGAHLTRYPPGLVAALTRLAEAPTAVPGASRASAHLWLEQPFGPVPSEASASTHPAIEIRIATLREL